MYISSFKKNPSASSRDPILQHLPSGHKSFAALTSATASLLLTAALKTFGFYQHSDAWAQARAIPSKKEQLQVQESVTC